MFGANTSTPTDGTTGDVCPQGSYCPAGSSRGRDTLHWSTKLIIIISPLLLIFNFTILLSPLGSYCPQGTFGNTTGLRSANECIACEPGYYCPTQGHVKPYDQCNAGYYCSGGSIEANPVAKTYGYVCPVGHYCPKGTPILVPCPKGTYQPGTGRAEMFIYWFIKLHDQMSECWNCNLFQFCVIKL